MPSRVLIALSLSCYGLFLRFWTLKDRNFWNDEVYQFNCIKGAFKPFWLHQTYGDHSAFPGEYILSFPLVNTFGMNKWILAIPHVFFTILGFYLLYRLCCQYMRSWSGFTAAFLIYALNENLVYHSFEFRPYAVLPVMALASLWLVLKLKEDYQKMSFLQRFSAAAGIIFIINYHAYGLAIFMLPLIFVLISGKGVRNALPWKFLAVILAVAGAVWLWYASYNSFGFLRNVQAQSPEPTFYYIANPMLHPWVFLKEVVGNLLGNRFFYALLIACIPFWPHPQRLNQFIFLLILVLLPLGIILYTDLKSQYWFLQRQFVWVISFFALWVGWSIDSAYLYARGENWFLGGL